MKFTLEAYKLNDLAHGVSVSPTVMQGGSIRNAISDASEIYLDTRFLRDEQIEKLDRELRELASRTWVDEVTAELTIDHGRPAMRKRKKRKN